ncbi:uncharacterized protein TRIADDRAFT_58456 [Trichoplax adhaerens]|uniref:Uncharacterized protein n=1 Tax=Trichoplax adhaerens TaxID=10228 RepID=B3S2R6_TRIAD|nr:predicted protein [Trichoplax adhaerens]EDV22667.1 predicted protein [Trichoplax adhaerens]|eukprot:XP_002114533.1 predicted protein [Trichoplax adhaerens]
MTTIRIRSEVLNLVKRFHEIDKIPKYQRQEIYLRSKREEFMKLFDICKYSCYKEKLKIKIDLTRINFSICNCKAKLQENIIVLYIDQLTERKKIISQGNPVSVLDINAIHRSVHIDSPQLSLIDTTNESFHEIDDPNDETFEEPAATRNKCSESSRAKDFLNLVNIQDADTESPLLMDFSDQELSAAIRADTRLEMPSIPGNTRAVKRTIKLISEACSYVVGYQNRRNYILNTLKSRSLIPGIGWKKDFFKCIES